MARLLSKVDAEEADIAARRAAGWSAAEVLRRVCGVVGADEARVRGGRRARPEVVARALTAWLASERLREKTIDLAVLLGTSDSAVAQARRRGDALAKARGLTDLDDLPEPKAMVPVKPALTGVTLEDLLAVAAEEASVTVEALVSSSRQRHLTRARRAVAQVGAEELGRTRVEIAAALARTPSMVSRWARGGGDDDGALARRLVAQLRR